MLVTLPGIVTLVMLVNPENSDPMLVEPAAIVTLVRSGSSENAAPAALPGMVMLARLVQP